MFVERSFAEAAAASEEGVMDGETFLDVTADDLRASPPDGLGLSKMQQSRVRAEIKKKACS
jgi:hypothetical protein